MADLTPRFSANRAVCEYTESHYLPAAAAYRQRADHDAAMGKQIVEWQSRLKQNWPLLRFGDVKVDTNGPSHQFEVQVYLNGLDPQNVELQIYADKPPFVQKMDYVKQLGSNMHVYHAAVPSSRPAKDFTPRLIPFFPGAFIPLEAPQILWQH
jgi:glycogen phosphorylase